MHTRAEQGFTRARRDLDIRHRLGAAALAPGVLFVRQHIERQPDGLDHGIDGTRPLPVPGLEAPFALHLERQTLRIRPVGGRRQLVRAIHERRLGDQVLLGKQVP